MERKERFLQRGKPCLYSWARPQARLLQTLTQGANRVCSVSKQSKLPLRLCTLRHHSPPQPKDRAATFRASFAKSSATPTGVTVADATTRLQVMRLYNIFVTCKPFRMYSGLFQPCASLSFEYCVFSFDWSNLIATSTTFISTLSRSIPRYPRLLSPFHLWRAR
jgi:hypothetical protein